MVRGWKEAFSAEEAVTCEGGMIALRRDDLCCI